MLNGNNLGYFEPEGQGCIVIEYRGLRGTPPGKCEIVLVLNGNNLCYFQPEEEGCKSKVNRGAGGYHYWNI